MSVELPYWAEEYVRIRHDGERNLPSEWEGADPFHETPRVFSRTIHIAYPNGVYYYVEKLEDGKWVSLTADQRHHIPETAIAAAQKRAYNEGIPHRVQEAVWND